MQATHCFSFTSSTTERSEMVVYCGRADEQHDQEKKKGHLQSLKLVHSRCNPQAHAAISHPIPSFFLPVDSQYLWYGPFLFVSFSGANRKGGKGVQYHAKNDTTWPLLQICAVNSNSEDTSQQPFPTTTKEERHRKRTCRCHGVASVGCPRGRSSRAVTGSRAAAKGSTFSSSCCDGAVGFAARVSHL